MSDGFVTMSDGCKLYFQCHGNGGETVIVPNGLFYATDWQRLATNRTVVEERCRAFWSILRPLYVWDRSYADKLDWGRCDLPNERAAFGYVHRYVFPSMQSLALTAADFSALDAPVLLIHGRYDRSAPFGGALDWAALLPNARVMAVETGHAPWIEQPDSFFEAVEAFLDGHWPNAAADAG